MRVLGIETSCDETSAAIVEGDDMRATMAFGITVRRIGLGNQSRPADLHLGQTSGGQG